MSVWVGCPLAMFWATFSFFGLGGVASHGAGIMVWVGNPVFMPMAVSYFAGLGMIMFVGGGSAVLVGSPVAMPSALMVSAVQCSAVPLTRARACVSIERNQRAAHHSFTNQPPQAWSGPSMSMMTDDVMNPESTFGVRGLSLPFCLCLCVLVSEDRRPLASLNRSLNRPRTPPSPAPPHPQMMNHTTMEMDMGMNMTMDHMMMMEMPAMFWVQGNTEADGKGAAYVTGGGAVDYYPRPKWASHLLESDPEYNLWEHGMTNRTHRGRARRAQEAATAVAPLSAASLTEALALFGSDPVGTPKLLAMGLDVNGDVDVSQPAVYEQFKGWVPGPMLDGAKGLAVLKRQMQQGQGGDNEDRGGQDEPATLRVENALLDYCGVCETAGEVTGAGTEVCDVEASCQTLQARAPPAAQALFDFDEVRALCVCAAWRGMAWRGVAVLCWLAG